MFPLRSAARHYAMMSKEPMRILLVEDEAALEDAPKQKLILR
jgi:hypothetical protein